jgi:DNA-binding NarL/FixJ family response regulator
VTICLIAKKAEEWQFSNSDGRQSGMDRRAVMLHCNRESKLQLHWPLEGSVMSSLPECLGKPALKAPPVRAQAPAGRDGMKRAGTAEAVLLPAPAQAAAESKERLTGPSQASVRTRLAYGLLKAAMDEAVQTIESNRAALAGEWRGLQAHTVESVHASALAIIELMEALNRARVGAAQFPLGRPQRDAMDRQVAEFLAAARNMISVLTAPPSDPPVDCSKPDKCPVGPCNAQSVAERLRTLTQQQRRVLELIAEGLPNKVIAYELGLCETTVKAHVSGILRKLCVYNRARVIALLANIDLASISSPPRS